MATKKGEFRVIIDVGNGVCVNAPFKKKWKADEWQRMSRFMDRAIKNHLLRKKKLQEPKKATTQEKSGTGFI